MSALPSTSMTGRRQRGFSLIAVMIILVIVSLLGVAGSQMVLVGERSARYDRDYQIAYQAAEAALTDAEFDLRGPNSAAAQRVDNFSNTSLLGFVDGCGTGNDRGLCLPTESAKPVWLNVDFTDTTANARTVRFGEFTGRTMASGLTGAQPAMLPRYIIEAIPDQTPGSSLSTPKILHRVTAMGFGPRVETQAVVQMYFRKD